jgi:ParB-like nuclease domain
LTDAPPRAKLVALADRIELWPTERLRPYERNPPTHNQAQVDQIAASMVEFGWTNPILVDENAGILAGHGRPLAARKLELAEVPVIRFEHLSEAQKRAYLIADNQLALQAGWDDALLAEELAWLRDERFDLDLIGFDASELERLLALADSEAARNEAEDEVPEPPEDPVSKPGDLWVLGKHRLLCGDATVLADVDRVLGGQLADMTFCGSPYNVEYANSPKDKLRGKHRPILNDDLGGGFEAFLYYGCVNILSVTKGARYFRMISSELQTLQRAFATAGVPGLFRQYNGPADFVEPVPVRVIARRPDTIVGFGETRIHAETATFEVRPSEVANPYPGDQLTVGGEAFVVQGEPGRRDPDRLVWSLDVRRA